jgi:uncharacterized repeat protein (TIGR03803 family)
MAGIGTATGALAQSYKESVLFGFCDQCSKGYEPLSWLYRETTGNLFGITHLGSNSGGTAYELVYDQTKQSYTRQILHGFCTQANCSDGGAPYAGVIADQSGNLYGTASAKGANNGGVIYELYFDQTKQKWQYKVLYNFCAQAGCADGSTPTAGLTMDDSGNLYGTTYAGGTDGYGTVYELAFNQTKQKWQENVLYSFVCGPNSCPDGGNPSFGLYLDPNGNFFGTSSFGANSGGTVYELSYGQTKKQWVYSVVYNFCGAQHCDDGSTPTSRLIEDASGNLYGITATGGTHGEGTVYELSGGQNGYSHTVLYNFCSTGGANCTDGQNPTGGLYMSSPDLLIGTTGAGGANKSGTVYELSYDTQTKQWSESLLYSFCTKAKCTDGSIPTSGVITDASGDFYGTTEAGGKGTFGTVFELTPAK